MVDINWKVLDTYWNLLKYIKDLLTGEWILQWYHRYLIIHVDDTCSHFRRLTFFGGGHGTASPSP